MNFYSLGVLLVIFVVGILVYTCERQGDEDIKVFEISEEL